MATVLHTRELLSTWNRLHAVRTVMSLAASALYLCSLKSTA